jgi:tRNA-binding EMAP/Myf-like protein
MNHVLDKIILVDAIVCLKFKKIRVPKLSMSKGMICDLEDLELSQENLSKRALQSRENYAKISLILFYPFQDSRIFSILKMNACGTK